MKSHIYTFDIVLTFTEKRKTNNHRLPFTLLVFFTLQKPKKANFCVWPASNNLASHFSKFCSRKFEQET